MTPGRLHIGEVARRTGVAPALLRAWEQRYGLIDPARTPGGTRLYGPDDIERILAMKAHLAQGLSAAQAAGAVEATAAAAARPTRPAGPSRGPNPSFDPNPSRGRGWPADATGPLPPPGDPADGDDAAVSELASGARELADAFGRLDSLAAERALENLLAAFSFETLATAVLLPYLSDVGGRWARGEASVAEEHLATNIVRARLLSLGMPWTTAGGGRAVLACPPQERHDLPLVMLAVSMRRRGWQVVLLGADTPVGTTAEAAEHVGADLIVLAATREEHLRDVSDEVRELAGSFAVFVGGAGASDGIAAACGARRLHGDPVSAQRELEPFRNRAS